MKIIIGSFRNVDQHTNNNYHLTFRITGNTYGYGFLHLPLMIIVKERDHKNNDNDGDEVIKSDMNLTLCLCRNPDLPVELFQEVKL